MLLKSVSYRYIQQIAVLAGLFIFFAAGAAAQDTSRPYAVITRLDPFSISQLTLRWQVEWSEPLSSPLTLDGIVSSNSSSTQTLSVTGSGQSYTVSMVLHPSAVKGLYNFYIKDAAVQDLAGNFNFSIEGDPYYFDNGPPSASFTYYNSPVTDFRVFHVGLYYTVQLTRELQASDLIATGTLSHLAFFTVTEAASPSTENRTYTVKMTLSDPSAEGSIGFVLKSGIPGISGKNSETQTSRLFTVVNQLPRQPVIQNPGLESAAGWEPVNFQSYPETVQFMQGDAHEGSGFVRLHNHNQFFYASGFLKGPENTFQLKGSRLYRINCRIRGTGRLGIGVIHTGIAGPYWIGNGFTIIEYYYDSPPDDSTGSSPPIADEWVEYSGTISTTSPGLMRLSWEFSFRNWGDRNSYIDIDDIWIEDLGPRSPISYGITAGVDDLTYETGVGIQMRFLSVDRNGSQLIYRRDLGHDPTIHALPYYWDIRQPSSITSFSAIPTFEYTDEELSAAGLSESGLKVLRRVNGGAWEVIPASVDPQANTVTLLQPVSSFSDWTLGTLVLAGAGLDWTAYE